MTQQQCAWCCKSLRNAQRCSRCKSVHYCTRECQKNHWVLHKTECGVPFDQRPLYYTRFEKIDALVRSVVTALPHTINLFNNERYLEGAVQHFGLQNNWDLFWSRFIEVRASPIHGNGVFTTRPIPANVVVTFYPAHFMVTHNNQVAQLCDCECDTSLENLAYICDYYGYDLTPGLKIVGLPEQYRETKYVGHLINDSCQRDPFQGVPVDHLHDLQILSRLLCQFHENMTRYTNCGYVTDAHNMLCALVTTRPLNSGEELLLPYGLPYWLEKNYGRGFVSSDPFIKKDMKLLYENDEHFRVVMDTSVSALKGHALGMHLADAQ